MLLVALEVADVVKLVEDVLGKLVQFPSVHTSVQKCKKDLCCNLFWVPT